MQEGFSLEHFQQCDGDFIAIEMLAHVSRDFVTAEGLDLKQLIEIAVGREGNRVRGLPRSSTHIIYVLRVHLAPLLARVYDNRCESQGIFPILL